MTSCTCGNYRERMGEHRETCPQHPKNRVKHLLNVRRFDNAMKVAVLLCVFSGVAIFLGIAAWIVRWGFGF